MAKSTANKTIETKDSVADFLKKIKDEKKRNDCKAIMDFIGKHTGMKAKMWGTAIVGFGSYHYVYDSGREGDAPLSAFAPRASSIVIYLYNLKENAELLKKLGKHKLSGGCVHIKALEDIDTKILGKLIDASIKYIKKTYPDK